MCAWNYKAGGPFWWSPPCGGLSLAWPYPMNTTRALAVALLCSGGLASHAAGQTPKVVVGGAVGASFQGEGESDSPYLGPGFGGTAPALIVFVDGPIASRFAVGGELTWARDISGGQSQRVPGGSNVFVSEHHDTVTSATLKFASSHDDVVHVAVMGGAGLATRHTHRAGRLFRNSPPFEGPPFEETITSFVPAFAGGIDTVVRLGNRAGIVVAGRLHYLLDDDRQDDGVVERGVSNVIFRFGAGLHVRF